MRFPRPTVGAAPPARRLPVVGDRPPPASRHVVADAGRVFALFGPAGAGVSTLLRALHEESETPTALITVVDADLVETQVATARRSGVEAIFLDGRPVSVEDVQWLYEARLVAPGWGGGILRVDRNAVVDLPFTSRLSAIEARIQALSMPYFVVHNDDVEQAAVDLAGRMGLWR